MPACVEACPTGAIQFGDLNHRPAEPGSFRLLEKLGTDPKIYYHSQLSWVRDLAAAPGAKEKFSG